jgi:hypothetical protein
MTIKDVSVSSTKEFFDVLEDLRLKGVVFRGHRDAIRYRITSTLSRHHGAPYNPRTSWEVDEMLRHFLGNLQLVIIHFPSLRTIAEHGWNLVGTTEFPLL